MASAAWTVARTGDQVRIDLTEADEFGHEDTEAIEAALEDYLADDGVKVVKLGGPVLMKEGPPDGLGPAMKHLGNLARSRGKRFEVGPI